MLVAAIAITGCASAAAKTSAPRSSGAGRQVRIMVYSINSDGPDFRAVLAGTIGDYGPAVTVLKQRGTA
jgi:hypothetical protein